MDRSASLLGAGLAALTAIVIILSGLPRYAFLITGIGPIFAGALANSSNYEGAAEGTISAGTAVPITLVVIVLVRLIEFQRVDLLWLTTGPQAIGSIFIIFPLSLVCGAILGWLGQLFRDIVGGDISIK